MGVAMRHRIVVLFALSIAAVMQGPRVALAEATEVVARKSTSVPVNIGLVPYLDVNSHFSQPRNNLSIDGIVGVAWTLDGAAISGVSGFVRDAARGLQLSGVSGYIGGELIGAQIAGVVNVTRESATGLQLSGVVNYADEIAGAQIGIVNIGGKVKGLQLGLVNVADEVAGATVGLVNVVRKNGRHAIDVWTSNTAAFSVGTKLGSKHVYSILGIGLQPAKGQTCWMPTVGLGGSIAIDERWFLNLEALTSTVNIGNEFDQDSMLLQLRAAGGYKLSNSLAPFAGPVLDVFWSSNGKRLSDISYTATLATVDEAGTPVDLGLGFVVGLQAF